MRYVSDVSRMWWAIHGSLMEDVLRMKSTLLAYIFIIWCGVPEFSHGYIQEMEIKAIADNGEIVDHHYHFEEEPALNRYKRSYNTIQGDGEIHLLNYVKDQTYTYDAQSEEKCRAQIHEVSQQWHKNKDASGLGAHVAAIVDCGDTVMLQCHFCDANDQAVKSAKIWFKASHGLTSVDDHVYEVKLDVHDDEEINRVYTTLDHALIIKKVTVADAGTYFCEDYDVYDKYIKTKNVHKLEDVIKLLGSFEGVNQGYQFLYRVDVFMREQANTVRVSNEPGSYLPKPRTFEWNREEGYALWPWWSNWGPCSLCGEDKYGERKRRGMCTVSTANVKGRPIEWPKSEKLANILRMWRRQAPCHSSLFDRFTKIVSYPEQIDVEKCHVLCMSTGKNAEAKNFTAFQDINDILVDESHKGTNKAKVKTHDITEVEGINIRLICPGSTIETAVMWQNGSAHLKERDIEAKSKGRVTFDMTDNLIIRNLTKYDSGVYTCWYGGKKIAEFTVTVPDKPRVPLEEVHKGFRYLGMCYAVYFLVFLACLGVKHKQRMVQVRKMKSTKEEPAESTRKTGYLPSRGQNNRQIFNQQQTVIRKPPAESTRKTGYLPLRRTQ